MTKSVTASEFRKRLASILDRVARTQEQFIIERNGRPVAAVVPLAKLEHLDRVARRYLLKVLDDQPSHLTQDEADGVANEAKHTSRRRD